MGCIKHVYASHILLQFELNNTLEDQLLEGVSVEVDPVSYTHLTLPTKA